MLPPDASVCGDFQVTVDLTIPGVTETPGDLKIHNIATLASVEKPTLTAETLNPLNAFVKPTLAKTADPVGTVKPGATITYKLCYANDGNANLTDVVLTDAIPGRTEYVAGSASDGGVYDAVTKTLTWTIGTLGPNTSKCVTFKVAIPLTLPGVTEQNQGWTVDNTATLKNAQVPEKKSTTSNPLDATVKPVLTKTAAPAGDVYPGDKITYELCYANQGTANLTGVVLTDVIPANTTYVAGSATGTGITYNEATRTLSWAIGTLAPGANACVTFQVTVNMIIETATGQAGAMSFAEWTSMALTNIATLKTDQVSPRRTTPSTH